MNIAVSKELVELYKKENKNIEYSLLQLINSMPPEYLKQVLPLMKSVTIEGESCVIDVKIEILAKIKHGNLTLTDEELLNIFLWMAFLFPEI